jgi:radical SAM protein with 4Fe4S-binding SPASM domain
MDLRNLIGALVNLKMKRAVVTSRPFDLNVEVTNICNFRCAYCRQSSPDHFSKVKRSELSSENAGRMLRMIRELGYRQPTVHWTLDGEPFMNKEFPLISKVAADLGYKNQYFSTNGALLTSELCRSLSPDVKYTFCTDFCADREFFEKYRGTEGSWDRILSNMRDILADNGLANMRFMISDISPFAEQDPVVLQERLRALKGLFPDEGRRVVFSMRQFHNAQGFLDLGERRHGQGGRKYHVCPYPWTSLIVASNGDVVPCCRDWERMSVLGNVFDEPLEDIWNGERFVALRRALLEGRPGDVAACRDCDLPYDSRKHSIRHKLKTLFSRFQFLSSSPKPN